MRDWLLPVQAANRRPTGSQKQLRDFIAERAGWRGFTADRIIRQDRTGRISQVRHLIMAEAYATGKWSFLSLAKGFERDHSTIVYAVQKVRAALAQQEAA